MHKLTFLLLSVSLFIFSCKKDETSVDNDNISIEISAISDGKAAKINEELNHLSGLKYKISDLKIYISNIRLVNHQGEDIKFQMENIPGSEQGVFLYLVGSNESFSGSLPDNHYTRLKFDVGLAPTLNDLNPNQFSKDHPLSRDTDMYWDMMKYRFVFFDGKLDKAENGSFDFPFSYHLGGDDFLRSAELDINLNVSGDKKLQIPVKLNLDKFFTDNTESIDINSFFSYHSGDGQKETGLLMMDFIRNSFK